MKILICINHPADVHLFKNFIWRMKEKGHTFTIVARDKDKTIELLDRFGFSYILTGKAETTPFGYAREAIDRAWKIRSIIREGRSEMVISQMDPSPAIAAKMMSIPYLCLADTEHAKFIIRTTLPLTRAVLTPSCFMTNLGKKQINYNGYKELAYLHPNVFKPDISVLHENGLNEDDHFIILRFVSWGAHHDIGQHGIQDKIGLVNKLERYGRVLITSEGDVPPELISYQVKVSPEKMHDLLFYAALYMGEGGTMASEAAILGTPSIFVSSLTGTMGNFIELERTYDLLYSFEGDEQALKKAITILTDNTSKEKWKRKREKLIVEKINLTEYMVMFIENYIKKEINI